MPPQNRWWGDPARDALGDAVEELHRGVIDGPAEVDREVRLAEQWMIGQHVADRELRLPIRDQTVGPLRRVLAQQHDGVHEVRIQHVRPGRQQRSGLDLEVLGHRLRG